MKFTVKLKYLPKSILMETLHMGCTYAEGLARIDASTKKNTKYDCIVSQRRLHI